MLSLRQIFHEATGDVAVALAERFRVEPFEGKPLAVPQTFSLSNSAVNFFQ